MVQCKFCKISLARVKADSIMKCEGDCEGVYHKKCGVKIKAFTDTGLCDECQIMQAGQPSIKLDLSKTTPEKLLAEVNEKLAIVFNMKKTLESMSEDISFYAEKYQELIEEKEKTDKKIKALEHKNSHLETVNKSLEERIAYLEIQDKERNVEVFGLEEKLNENLETTVKHLAEKLGVNAMKINEIKRVGEEKTRAAARNTNSGRSDSANVRNKPRPVIITLSSRAARDQWLLTRKTHQLTNDDIFANGNKQRIYINEDLTKYIRNILWTAKNELKPTYKYIWVQNGRVLIKKDDPNDTKIRSVRTLSDINMYLNECTGNK